MIVLRSLLFNAVYFALSAGFALYGTFFCRTQPSALALAQSWARTSVAAARIICGMQLRVSGRAYLPDGPCLVACQHQSAYDTMIWLILVPRTAYVMKQEVARLPLFGALTVRAGMIPVDRGGGGASLRGLMRAAARAIAAGQQIVIFPEGTRSAPGVETKLQPGIAAIATHTGLAVIPVRTNSGDLWGRRHFIKRPGIIHMEILPPLPAGLKRGPLLQALQLAFHPVDKPVGSPSAGF